MGARSRRGSRWSRPQANFSVLTRVKVCPGIGLHTTSSESKAHIDPRHITYFFIGLLIRTCLLIGLLILMGLLKLSFFSPFFGAPMKRNPRR